MGAGFPSTKAAQLAAITAVIDPDLYADYRKICRWFSRVFSTPLMEVYNLPSDFVLMHYLEDQYESLTPLELREKLIELTETPEQRIERRRKEAQEDHKSYTESKSTLDQVMAKISKMRGSDIKSSLDTYRSELAEKKMLKEGAKAEQAPKREDILAALMGAKAPPMVPGIILPKDDAGDDESPEFVKTVAPTVPRAQPPPDYPDFDMKFDDNLDELEGIDLDADSVSALKK